MKIKIFYIIILINILNVNTQQLTLQSNLDSTLSETSGLLYLNNTLISHNDSDATNQLYDIDITTGNITRTVTITNATNTDWEDLTHDDTYIYIGDIGNYTGERTDLKIYRIPIAEYFANTSVTADIINFNYSNQTDYTPSPLATNFDAEALIHYNNNLYIFSKNWIDGKTNIYPLSKTPGTYSITNIDTVESQGLVSGATYNSLDNSILICGYDLDGAFLIELSGFSSGLFSNGNFTKTSVAVPTNYSTQIEGITPINATDYYISAEQNNSNSQGLYYFDISSLEVESFEQNSIGLYPNPAQEFFKINDENCVVSIYTLDGKLIKTSSETEVNISELSTGIYLVQIQNKETHQSITKRLIID
ncbi:T9SS type A sorting domain-containing protein [Winogradskyella litoriviva]|uniref:T9SS type A sorting domain-containing protein n=1 Tax=Winogradskyella litoriviva TaxID=1220182 RepID=A0ABX2E7R2_9FLAO|nr:T9SS type A sorting domain-containing protein [Winogradskyella litoriviva]NRD23741.1 T9SS type A sorting domain-containing protein [Winogradskyella litoriviva]